jgi:hypothetical protein
MTSVPAAATGGTPSGQLLEDAEVRDGRLHDAGDADQGRSSTAVATQANATGTATGRVLEMQSLACGGIGLIVNPATATSRTTAPLSTSRPALRAASCRTPHGDDRPADSCSPGGHTFTLATP